MNSTNSSIIRNVRINNIEVSGLTQHEAEEKLISKVNSIMSDQIILKHGEYETIVTLKQMELNAHVQEKVYDACTIGRDKNIILNNYRILKTLIFGENLDGYYNVANIAKAEERYFKYVLSDKMRYNLEHLYKDGDTYYFSNTPPEVKKRSRV